MRLNCKKPGTTGSHETVFNQGILVDVQKSTVET